MNPTEEKPAGYRIKKWCALSGGISEQMLHLLNRQGRGPHLTRLGRRLTLITEPPADYLQRMAAEPESHGAIPQRPPAARPAKPPTATKAATALPSLSGDLVLVKLDTARRALVEARSIDDVKKIIDVAKAMKVFAERQQLSEEIKGHAHAIWADGLRKWGRSPSKPYPATGRQHDDRRK